MSSCVTDLLDEVRKRIVVDADKKSIGFLDSSAIEALNKFRECVVGSVAGNELKTVFEWLSHVKEALTEVSKALGVVGYTLPKEFASFASDPVQHLKKKIFNYSYDLVRGNITVEEFLEKASKAITTSIRANMRSCYQLWALTKIMCLMARRGYTLSYPENKYLNFDRSGKQKLGVIPPNFILFNIGKGYISFFYEAPRPLSWEDTEDLQRVWKLYTALRPDVMVYSGRVLDIVDLSNNPPIKRPNIILEFKELDDWWKRARDLKGYFRKPLTAEEWRSKWIDGLFSGLAEAMGVKKSDVKKRVEEGGSLRLKEYQIVTLYKTVYKPDRMFLISRKETPNEVKKYLMSYGIEVIDSVEFDSSKLEPVVDALESFVSMDADTVVIELRRDVVKKLEDIRRKLDIGSIEEVIELAVKVLENAITVQGR